MQAAVASLSRYRPHASLGRRAGALALAIGVVALVIWLLVLAGVIPSGPAGKPLHTTFALLPDRSDETRHAETVVRTHRAAQRAAAAKTSTVAPPKPRRPTPPETTAPATAPGATGFPPGFITLSRNDFAASDVSRLPSHPRETASADTGDASGASSSDSASTAGPNGERMYDAQWYSRPTHAQLAGYLPRAGAPDGAWAMIVCRTIADYRVEDCRELGESPPGSGLSRTLRQAAWQFRVRPPRVGGHTLVGTWVRIRFDFTATGRADD